MKYFITMGDRIHEVDLVRRLGELLVTVNGEPMDLTYSEADRFGQVTLLHDGRSFGISIEDRKSTRLNSSHVVISYAVFCLKKQRKQIMGA